MWQIRLPLSLLGELLRCLCKGSESWQSAFQRFPHKKSLDGERQGSVDTGWLESNHIKLWRLFVSFCYKAEVLDLHRGSRRTIACIYIYNILVYLLSQGMLPLVHVSPQLCLNRSTGCHECSSVWPALITTPQGKGVSLTQAWWS